MKFKSKLLNLIKKEKSLLKRQKKENTNALENAMLKAIKKQAEAKNYTWK